MSGVDQFAGAGSEAVAGKVKPGAAASANGAVKMVKLGDLMLRAGGTVNPAAFPEEKFELYSIPAHDKGGPEYLAGGDIGSSKQCVQPGDVLISKIIPHIRRSRVVGPFSGLRQIASGEWIIFRADQFEPDYLRQFLLSNRFHVQFMNTVAGVGGSLLRARPEHVKSILVPLPPLEEQRRIAEILDRADEIRAKHRRQLAHLDDLTQAIFHDMFGDPDEAVESVSFDDVADLKGGRNLVAEDSTANSPYRVLKISAVTSGHYKPEESKPLPADYIPPSDHLVHDGDLLMSRANTSDLVGATAYVHHGSSGLALPDKIWRFVWKNPASVPQYYQALFQTPSMRRRISNLASGTGGSMKNVSKSNLAMMKVPVAPVSLQQLFLSKAGKVQARKATIERALVADDELFASLQSRAFTGQL